jgi:hypothetical protein
MGFEGGQDPSAGGRAILEAKNIVRLGVKHLKEIPSECSRVIDASLKGRKLRLLSILGWRYQLHNIYKRKARTSLTPMMSAKTGNASAYSLAFLSRTSRDYVETHSLREGT